MALSSTVIHKLQYLAEKYENEDFIIGDPSRVLKRYKTPADIEIAAFISALLSFGRRDQFLKKIDIILDSADRVGGPAQWIKTKEYEKIFGSLNTSAITKIQLQNNGRSCIQPQNTKPKFYRFYSYDDMNDLFNALYNIIVTQETLGAYFKEKYCNSQAQEKQLREKTTQYCPQTHLSTIISNSFPECAIVPHTSTSANKRVQMFLRWMVRQNSPIDTGIWTWYKPENLLMPLDTHVIQQSINLGLLPEKCTGTFKTAQLLTEVLKEVWPEDPVKGDFALFGLGVTGDYKND